MENQTIKRLKELRIFNLGSFWVTDFDKSLVVSSTDVVAAVTYLNSLPYSALTNMPATWRQEQLLVWIKDELPNKIKVGDSFQLGAGIYGHVVPLGCDLLSFQSGGTLQLIISIRSWNTDINQLIKL